MALIECPECSKKVSSIAKSCPNCGAPIAIDDDEGNTTTIQMTSKKLKSQGCFSSLLIGLGVLLAGLSGGKNESLAKIGAYVAIAGIIWAVVTRLRVWWQHD